jgi:hypothetical protein
MRHWPWILVSSSIKEHCCEKFQSTIHVLKLKKVRKLRETLIRVRNIWARPECRPSVEDYDHTNLILTFLWFASGLVGSRITFWRSVYKKLRTALSVNTSHYGWDTRNAKLYFCELLCCLQCRAMNCGGFDGSNRSPIWEVRFRHLPGGTKQNHETVRIVSVAVEIRTEYLSNISVQRYR